MLWLMQLEIVESQPAKASGIDRRFNIYAPTLTGSDTTGIGLF